MRRLLGSVLPALAVVAVLASGCGDEEGGSATDDSTPTSSGSTSTGTPTETPTEPPTETPTETSTDAPPLGEVVDVEMVDIMTETAAGGTVSELAVPLGDQAAVDEFTAQFEPPRLPGRVNEAVAGAEVPDGMLLYGAVIAVGCDAPPGLQVVTSEAGLQVTAAKVPSPHVECFAPMTTVAVFLVPASAVA
jgi:hypothetical protein